jgi:hypothetical protein
MPTGAVEIDDGQITPLFASAAARKKRYERRHVLPTHDCVDLGTGLHAAVGTARPRRRLDQKDLGKKFALEAPGYR